jgi:peroxiredoxin
VKLQEQISEIIKLNAEVVAISTTGDQQNVEKSKKVLEITYFLVPKPNGKVGEDYGLKVNSSGAAYATIIIDQKGHVRFKGDDDRATRTTASRIIKELQVIQ